MYLSNFVEDIKGKSKTKQGERYRGRMEGEMIDKGVR